MDTPASQSAAFALLIQNFVEMRVTAHDFEIRYRRLVNDNREALDSRVAKAVTYVFDGIEPLEPDDYLHEPDGQGRFDEHLLRTRARRALIDLRRLQRR